MARPKARELIAQTWQSQVNLSVFLGFATIAKSRHVIIPARFRFSLFGGMKSWWGWL
jgi:hypothetical protein